MSASAQEHQSNCLNSLPHSIKPTYLANMSKIQSVFTEKAPKPLPQFSQAVKFNGMVYCSGNIGIDPKTAQLVDGTVKDRAVRRILHLTTVYSVMIANPAYRDKPSRTSRTSSRRPGAASRTSSRSTSSSR